MMVGQRLRHWFSEPLGRQLLALEQSSIECVLPNMFGYHILQLGCLIDADILGSSRISHKILLQLEQDDKNRGDGTFVCAGDSLAILSDCMDVIVMPHVLEFAANPHKLLREAERVLIGEGHILILGFNPWSLWGVWRLLLAWREKPPWSGHFYGSARIKDWLSLLDFEILQTQRFFFRPPLRKINIMQKLNFLEYLGKYCWPFFGGAYLIVAKKRVVPLTPTKLNWSSRRKVIAAGIAEPSIRLP